MQLSVFLRKENNRKKCGPCIDNVKRHWEVRKKRLKFQRERKETISLIGSRFRGTATGARRHKNVKCSCISIPVAVPRKRRNVQSKQSSRL